MRRAVEFTDRQAQVVLDSMESFKVSLEYGLAPEGEAKETETIMGFRIVDYITQIGCRVDPMNLEKNFNADYFSRNATQIAIENQLYVGLSMIIQTGSASWSHIKSQVEGVLDTYVQLVLGDEILSRHISADAQVKYHSNQGVVTFDMAKVKRDLLEVIKLAYQDPTGRVLLKEYLKRQTAQATTEGKWAGAPGATFHNGANAVRLDDEHITLAQCILMHGSGRKFSDEKQRAHVANALQTYQQIKLTRQATVAAAVDADAEALATAAMPGHGAASAAASSAVAVDTPADAEVLVDAPPLTLEEQLQQPLLARLERGEEPPRRYSITSAMTSIFAALVGVRSEDDEPEEPTDGVFNGTSAKR